MLNDVYINNFYALQQLLFAYLRSKFVEERTKQVRWQRNNSTFNTWNGNTNICNVP